MGALIGRDISLALRSASDWVLGIAFFTLFLSLCVLATGTGQILTSLAPAFIWLAFLLSALLSFSHIFTADFSDGSLAQIYLFSQDMLSITLSKTIAFAIIALGPLWVSLPIAGLAFGLEGTQIIGLMASLLIAAPAISAYGVFASALTVSRGSGGFLIFLITVPFLIPVFIFGISATEGFVNSGFTATPFKALLGLSLIALAIGLPAATVALKTNFE